ncbi:MAG: DNA-processing protein DprA [Pseudoflavonifractor sp.]|nr:DNA-processing protein DprA [Alloprevotella sp.]MCM1115992.1 DNA-processing protein DprA [Pseudoflavonifractor sp.]
MTADIDTDRLLYRIAFASLRGINQVLAEEFLMRLGSEQAFFEASARSLTSLTGGITSRLFDRDYRDEALERARREVDFVMANGVKAIHISDEEYPARLREAVDAPLMIYALGGADINPARAISIVGTRHATAYGTGFVDSLIADMSKELTEKPLVISGLAFGIDIAAHKAALREGCPTAAVLAHGLNTIYPAPHRQTAVEMVRSGGILITEYLSTDPVHKGNFLARNRIVAAMADCLVVAESAAKGGALVTARLADSYSRDVFAVPGRLGDKYSAGCNNLIAGSMAHLVRNATDIIETMRWPVKAKEEKQLTLFPEPDEPTVAPIIKLLSERGEARAADIALALNRPVGKVMATLVDLEFKGRVTSFPGGLYRPAFSNKT